MANYRDRKLLDLAHKVNVCQNCACYVAHGCEPAHANGIEHGKGQGIKSHDNLHAALCHDCHAWYDYGIGTSPCGCYDSLSNDKLDMWNRAHKKTFTLYFQNGWIGVTK